MFGRLIYCQTPVLGQVLKTRSWHCFTPNNNNNPHLFLFILYSYSILFYFILYYSRLPYKWFNHPFVVILHNELWHTHKQEMELWTHVCTSFYFWKFFTDNWRVRMLFLSSEIFILLYFILFYFFSFILFYFILFYILVGVNRIGVISNRIRIFCHWYSYLGIRIVQKGIRFLINRIWVLDFCIRFKEIEFMILTELFVWWEPE